MITVFQKSLFFGSESLVVELSSCLIEAITLSVPSPFNYKAIKFPTVCNICVQNESSHHITFFFFLAFAMCLARHSLTFPCPHGAGAFFLYCYFSKLYTLVGQSFLASLHGKKKKKVCFSPQLYNFGMYPMTPHIKDEVCL